MINNNVLLLSLIPVVNIVVSLQTGSRNCANESCSGKSCIIKFKRRGTVCASTIIYERPKEQFTGSHMGTGVGKVGWGRKGINGEE